MRSSAARQQHAKQSAGRPPKGAICEPLSNGPRNANPVGPRKILNNLCKTRWPPKRSGIQPWALCPALRPGRCAPHGPQTATRCYIRLATAQAGFSSQRSPRSWFSSVKGARRQTGHCHVHGRVGKSVAPRRRVIAHSSAGKSCSHGPACPSPSHGRLDLQPFGAKSPPRKVPRRSARAATHKVDTRSPTQARVCG